MPLQKGSSRATIWRNYRILKHEGYDEDQAWAIAYSKAGRGKKKETKRPKRPE